MNRLVQKWVQSFTLSLVFLFQSLFFYLLFLLVPKNPLLKDIFSSLQVLALGPVVIGALLTILFFLLFLFQEKGKKPSLKFSFQKKKSIPQWVSDSLRRRSSAVKDFILTGSFHFFLFIGMIVFGLLSKGAFSEKEMTSFFYSGMHSMLSLALFISLLLLLPKSVWKLSGEAYEELFEVKLLRENKKEDDKKHE